MVSDKQYLEGLKTLQGWISNGDRPMIRTALTIEEAEFIDREIKLAELRQQIYSVDETSYIL